MGLHYEMIPADDHANVTPHNTNPVSTGRCFRELVIGAASAVASTVVVTSKAGTDATYTVLPGQTIVIVGTHVKATGTTATGIVAHF